MPASRSYPRRTLENALRVPEALKQYNGGNPWASGEVAAAMSLGARSGNFWYVTAAARDYGLTEGTRDSTQIALTELGKQAVYPPTPQGEAIARLRAFLNIESFRKVLEHYGGNNLPEAQFLANTLGTTFGIEEGHQDEFVDIFKKNCRFLSIGETFDVTAALAGQPTRLGGARTGQPDGAGERETVTLAQPDDNSDAPICFVIMPFVERDDSHQVGFFDEVLAQLLAPAAKAAGFQVRTAMRQGSDVIQSTIVNDLLEADLVLCDLTEHNPNVLFELGLRIMAEKPVTLVKSRGTGRVFDVDNMLRVVEYSPNLWPSTVENDVVSIERHVAATWENRDSDRTFMRILRSHSDS